jgi:hypothetical protein
MERDDFSAGGLSQPVSEGVGTSGSTSAANGGALGESPMASDLSADAGGFGQESGTKAARVREIAGSARERLASVGSTLRERTGIAKDSLAGALHSGAERLRSTGGGELVAAGTPGSVALEGDGRMGQIGNRVAGGMDATADWLRDADLENIKVGVERQVRDHPARTLLIAVGLGYLLGKALRR